MSAYPMPPRTVALVAAVCVTIGWLLAAIVTPPVARLQSLPETPRAATAGEAQFTERLNLRLREAPPAPTTRRNPFNFGPSPRNATPAAGPTAQTTRETEPMTSEATRPTFAYALSGIGIAGELRTAVLTDGQHVRIVKVNDTVAEYTVLEITDVSITLASDTARQTLRLAQ
jgi:hypothetical protein